MRNVAFIPVRGGSQSIPLKNIKPMFGKPLVYWTAAAAAACKEIEAVYVSTDSDEIRRTVEALDISKVEVINRSFETATSTASSESALLEFAELYEFDNVAFIQATSPLLSTKDIDRAFELLEGGKYDSILSVVEDKRFYWKHGSNGAEPINYNLYTRPRRQDFEGWYQENGAIYVTTRELLLSSRNRISGRIGLLEMPLETAYEIDEPSDWEVVETLLRQKFNKDKSATNAEITRDNIKLFLTDCDGCLTDGGMYYSEGEVELKKFNTRDGVAFQILHEAGVKIGIVTGEDSNAVRRRAEKLQVDWLESGCKDKLAAVKQFCRQENINLSQVAYLGDDLNDFKCMEAVRAAGGITACPADATGLIQRHSMTVLTKCGGDGAVREFVDRLLGRK